MKNHGAATVTPALQALIAAMARSIVADYLTPKPVPALENQRLRSERVPLQPPQQAA